MNTICLKLGHVITEVFHVGVNSYLQCSRCYVIKPCLIVKTEQKVLKNDTLRD